MGAHVVDGCQAQLVLCNIFQVLVETHQLLLVIELRHNMKTTDNVEIDYSDDAMTQCHKKLKRLGGKARRHEGHLGTNKS